jgi:hypothetical protein
MSHYLLHQAKSNIEAGLGLAVQGDLGLGLTVGWRRRQRSISSA